MTSVFDLGKETARVKQIEHQVEIDPELPTIVCDPQLIHSAVMDLVSNAMDACAWKDYSEFETPKVVVRVRRSKRRQHLVIQVQDNGHGMTDEIKKNIFSPFFSTKSRIGTGMGLTLTSRIIRLHGGSIDVESKPNHGTTFNISLPIAGRRDQKEDLDA